MNSVKTAMDDYNNAISKISRASKDSPVTPPKPEMVKTLENILETSIIYFCIACHTAEFPTSKVLIKFIAHDSNILTGFEKYFIDWPSCKKFLTKTLRELFFILSSHLLVEAEKKAMEVIKKNSL